MKKKIAKIIVFVLIILTLIFIWGNSLLPQIKSKEQSDIVAEKIEDVVPNNTAPKDEKEFESYAIILRKYAHLIEFFILSVEVSVLGLLCSKMNFQLVWNVFSSSLLFAVVDESLQIISDRGHQIKDLLIDSVGIIAGIVVTFLFCIIIECLFGKQKALDLAEN